MKLHELSPAEGSKHANQDLEHRDDKTDPGSSGPTKVIEPISEVFLIPFELC